MEYNASVDGGTICSSYWCEECQEVLKKIDWTDFEDGIGFGDLIDNYSDLYNKR